MFVDFLTKYVSPPKCVHYQVWSTQLNLVVFNKDVVQSILNKCL
jgi:hypothetical protein